MNQTDTQELFFRSRVRKLSRLVPDEGERPRYEHNERLSVGEHVKVADGGAEGVVVKAGDIDLLSRREMVEILVNGERIRLAEEAVHRTLKWPPTY